MRHLLNQTSSLPLLPRWQLLANFDDRPGATERKIRALSNLKLTRPVGSAFEYSNLDFNLLGLIIEAASGETYANYLQNHIFNPLEISHSYTSKLRQSWTGWLWAINPGLEFHRRTRFAGANRIAAIRPADLQRGRYGPLPDRLPESRALRRCTNTLA